MQTKSESTITSDYELRLKNHSFAGQKRNQMLSAN